MSYRWPIKDKDETLDYSADWSRFLDTDTISSVAWHIDAADGTKTEVVTGAVTETYKDTKTETVTGSVSETYEANQTTNITGTLTETAATGNLTFTGGSVSSNGIVLHTHLHTGITPGPSNTGGPTQG